MLRALEQEAREGAPDAEPEKSGSFHASVAATVVLPSECAAAPVDTSLLPPVDMPLRSPDAPDLNAETAAMLGELVLLEPEIQALVEDTIGRPDPTRVTSTRPASVRGRRRHGRRSAPLAVEVAAASAVALLLAVSSPRELAVAVAALLLWVPANLLRARTVPRALWQEIQAVAGSVLVPLALIAVSVAVLWVPSSLAQPATVALLVAAGFACLCRCLEWRFAPRVRVLLLGDQVGMARAVARWEKSRRVDAVAAVLLDSEADEASAVTQSMALPVLNGLDAVPDAVRQYSLDLVVVCPGTRLSSIELRRLSWTLQPSGVPVGLLDPIDNVAPRRIATGVVSGATMIEVSPPGPPPLAGLLKGAFDRLAAAAFLIVTAPLLLMLAVLVRLDSPGRALYPQWRVGRDGQLFKVYKLRTMVRDADLQLAALAQQNESDAVLFKIRSDPRVTRIGGVLRRASLDELPQLFNVLKGEMSLVGPRPCLPHEAAAMDQDTLRRLMVRPGITGLWQVSGRSDLPWREAVALDAYYTDNAHPISDAAILVRTVRAVMSRRGAY